MKNMHAQNYRGSSLILAILRSFRAAQRYILEDPFAPAEQTSIFISSVKKIVYYAPRTQNVSYSGECYSLRPW